MPLINPCRQAMCCAVFKNPTLCWLVPLPPPPHLQAYVTPFLDLRFVTSYTNDGVNISCHTFQRRFSRRYLPYRDSVLPQLQPGTLVGSPSKEASQGPAGEPSAGAGQAAGESSKASVSMAADMDAEVSLLDDGALADSERSLGRTLGPVDPALKMAARKAAHGLVQYVQKAHLLTLRGIVCEFVRDSQGHLWFMGPLRTEWASLIPGEKGQGHFRWKSCIQGDGQGHVGRRGCRPAAVCYFTTACCHFCCLVCRAWWGAVGKCQPHAAAAG